jgi:rhodanese-related sulfurtransferase
MSRAIQWIVAALALMAMACSGPMARQPAPAANPPGAAAPRQSQPTPRANPPRPGSITRMPLGSFFPLQQTNAALIYDVRPAIFFSLGHIPGALSWPKNSFDSRLATQEAQIRRASLAKRPVVLYCTDLACPDSHTVATRLAALGYSVAILEGGYAAWNAGELPNQ